MLFNLQPVIVGALADAYGFSATRLGTIISMGLLGALLSLMTSPLWVNRLNHKIAVATGALISLAAIALFSQTTVYPGILICITLLGFGMGIIYVPALAGLAAAKDPTRGFAVALSTQVIVAGVSMFVIPVFLLPTLGFNGLLIFFALFTLGLFPTLPFVQNRVLPESRPASAHSINYTPFFGLLAMCVVFVGLNGAYAFLERAGNYMGLNAETIGSAFALAAIAGAAGAIAAGMLSTRLSVANALALSLGLLLIYALILEVATLPWQFATALLLLNLGWNFSLPFAMSTITRSDPTGQAAGLIPAAQLLGGVLGPVFASLLISNFGFYAVNLQLITLCLCGFALFTVISKPEQSSR